MNDPARTYIHELKKGRRNQMLMMLALLIVVGLPIVLLIRAVARKGL